MARNVLLAAGYEVIHASSGAEALKVWSMHRDEIDLLFSDIVMPAGLDGRKLAERLKLEKPHLKVLLTTGHHYKLKEQTAALATALFISKPFSAGALLQTVRLCLDGRSLAANVNSNGE
jgi:CheY-like chemotaxis protein